jgi:hypothetical protein
MQRNLSIRPFYQAVMPDQYYASYKKASPWDGFVQKVAGKARKA